MENTGKTNSRPQQTVVVTNVDGKKSNGVGTAGFVLALIGAVFCWAPFLNYILLVLGLILSFAGMFKAPRGLAIAGFVIAFLFLFGTILLTVGLTRALSL